MQLNLIPFIDKKNKNFLNLEHHNKRQLFIVILLITILPLTVADIYLSSLPSIANQFNTENSTVRLSFSVFLLALGASQLIYGLLADKYGRRKIILFGIAICFIGSFYCLCASSIEELIIGRLIQGLGSGGAGALARTIMSDLYNGRELSKISSYMSTSSSAFMIAAITLGGYIQYYFNWQGNFIFILIFIFICWLLIWVFLPETNMSFCKGINKGEIIFSNYILLLKSKIFMKHTLTSGLALAGMLCYLAVSPFLMLENLKLTSVEYGALSFFSSGSIVLGAFINTIILKRFDIDDSLLVGIFCMLIGGFSMLLFACLSLCNLTVIILPMVIYLIGAALMFANCFVKAFIYFPNMKGLAGGLYGTIQILTSSSITIITSLFSVESQLFLSITLSILSLGSLLLLKEFLFNSSKIIDL